MLNFDHRARVFRDEAQQSKLNDDGFVIVDFLNAAEVQRLNDLHNERHSVVNGFYNGIFSNDAGYRKEMYTAIQNEMQRSLEHYFFDYRVHCGVFLVKNTDEKSVVNMHQDMSLVDESAYASINIWIPLVDLTETNGVIMIIPRSHRLFKTYRGASLPSIYSGMETSIYKLMQPCYLKAGQAIIFDQGLIHYSPANQSATPRPVINTLITHQDAGIQISYWDKTSSKQEIELFDQAPDFMENFQNFGKDLFSKPSMGSSRGFVPYNFPKITPALLKQEYGFTEPEVKQELPKRRPFNELFKKIFTRS